MILIYGKWKVWTNLNNFLELINIKHEITDDKALNIRKNNPELTKQQHNYLNNFEKIIVSPWIPPHHQIYKNFPKKIISELNFLGNFLEKNNLREQLTIIWISGTNWKSTTTHVCYETLKKIYEWSTTIHLSWNFWTPLSETLYELIKKDNNSSSLILHPSLIIMECSSFMLYKLKSFYFDYSILTNIETDHLDRHPNEKDYKNTKINLINFTKTQSFTTNKVYSQLNSEMKNKTEIFNYDYDISNTKFVWHHNKANLQSVFLLTKKLLQDKWQVQNIQNLKSIIQNINPLAHRMQLFKTINNVDIYDDSICTSAHAQENALKGLEKKVVLICGWYDKWDSFKYLAELYKEKVWYAICIWDTAQNFIQIFTSQNIKNIEKQNFHDAIQTAFSYAQNNNLDVLFSPGCASFGMFHNVYHRIEEFEKEIKTLSIN